MSSSWSKGGPNLVPAYQMSGIPYVTSSISLTEVPNSGGGAGVSSPIEVDFPYVTKFLTIRNTGANGLRIAFTFSGSYDPGQTMATGGAKGHNPEKHNRNYFVIPSSGSSAENSPGSAETIQTFEVRCKKLCLLGDGGTTGFSLLAGLTTIPAGNFPILTGSVTGSASAKYPNGNIPAFEGIG